MFQPFPKQRGPVKLFVYGEPGTLKTRRSLQMPGPLFVIDMENGSCDYADLVNPEIDQYMATKSHAEVSQALDYLLKMAEEAAKKKLPCPVGTLIIDPVTVIWQSLQMGHVERTSTKKSIDLDEVDFDVGTWGRLKRLYGDLMTNLLNAPFHVVLIARGAEKTNAAGKKMPYGYDGEKNTIFLMKTVIETHANHDIVIKDRTGTYTEQTQVDGRVDFRRLLTNAGATPVRMQTDSEAAKRDAAEPITAAQIRTAANDAVNLHGWIPEQVYGLCREKYHADRPSDVSPAHWPELLTLFSQPPAKSGPDIKEAV